MEYETHQTTLLFLTFLLNPQYHELYITAGSHLVLILSIQLADIFHIKHSVQCSNKAEALTLIPALPPCCTTGPLSAAKQITPLYKTYEVYGMKTTAKVVNHHFKSFSFTIINWKCFNQQQHANL
jgi:hypothetical protein